MGFKPPSINQAKSNRTKDKLAGAPPGEQSLADHRRYQFKKLSLKFWYTPFLKI